MHLCWLLLWDELADSEWRWEATNFMQNSTEDVNLVFLFVEITTPVKTDSSSPQFQQSPEYSSGKLLVTMLNSLFLPNEYQNKDKSTLQSLKNRTSHVQSFTFHWLDIITTSYLRWHPSESTYMDQWDDSRFEHGKTLLLLENVWRQRNAAYCQMGMRVYKGDERVYGNEDFVETVWEFPLTWSRFWARAELRRIEWNIVGI
jgi:hypothetical protein